NKDTKRLYLTLNQGATNAAQSNEDDGSEKALKFTAIARSQNEQMTERLQKNAENIRVMIGNTMQAHGHINSGSPGYDAGAVYYKEYNLNDLPDDAQLISDLRDFVALYVDYYNKISSIEAHEDSAVSGGEEKLSIKELVAQINNYISSRGFTYENRLIE